MDLKTNHVFQIKISTERYPSNPSSPPRRVTWGDGTLDEMLFCFFLITSEKAEDLIHTVFDNLGHDLKQPRTTFSLKEAKLPDRSSRCQQRRFAQVSQEVFCEEPSSKQCAPASMMSITL
jgi:hypothetical protein